MIDERNINSALLMVWGWRIGRSANSLKDRKALMSAVRFVYDLTYEETKPTIFELEKIKNREFVEYTENKASKIEALDKCAEMFNISKYQVMEYADTCEDWYSTIQSFRNDYQQFVKICTR